MSTQSKNVLIKNIEFILVANISDMDCVDKCLDGIVSLLSKYNVDEQVTAVTVPNDCNVRILNRYLASLKLAGRADGTIAQYKRTLVEFSNMANIKLIDGTYGDIKLYLALLKKRGVQNSSLCSQLANISAFYRWCVKEGLIRVNPADSVIHPKCLKKLRLDFSSVEIDALRMACRKPKERAIVEMLLSSGVRVSELSNMNICDIDLRSKSAMVWDGKGGKDRKVYFSSLAAKHYGKYLSERKDSCPAAFIGQRLNRLTVSGIQRVLKRVADRAGVENCHPHRFRRTLATSLSDRGMDIQEIGKILGHSNLNVTMTYIALDDKRVGASYERFSS